MKSLYRRIGWLRTCFAIFVVLSCTAGTSMAEEGRDVHVAVVLSARIKPYVESMNGFMDSAQRLFSGFSFQTFVAADYAGRDPGELFSEIGKNGFSAVVAIGPEAATLSGSRELPAGVSFLYTMVLNPETILPESMASCGIPLNIPVAVQAADIGRAFPGILRIGLLYDPAHNTPFFEAARDAMQASGRVLEPLAVNGQKEIAGVMAAGYAKIDALWLIPDSTVITESIVKYIIKDALRKHRPVIGFNRFFLENGAALSFVVDYDSMGVKTAELLYRKMESENGCVPEVPAYRLMANEKILRSLGLQFLGGAP